MTDTFGIQVNIKTRAGSLLNVRGDSGEEVSSRLSDLSGLAQQVHELENLFEAAAALQGAGMLRNGNGGQQNGQRPAQNQPAQQGKPEPEQKEFCEHGKMTWKSGTSKAGNIYGLWECTQGCLGDDGKALAKWPPRKGGRG